jgi:hypothetical protein
MVSRDHGGACFPRETSPGAREARGVREAVAARIGPGFEPATPRFSVVRRWLLRRAEFAGVFLSSWAVPRASRFPDFAFICLALGPTTEPVGLFVGWAISGPAWSLG